MKKVMMAAPFDTKGRYKGGISSIVNVLEQKSELMRARGWELIRFETCRVRREQSQGSINLDNIRNFLKIYKDLPNEIRRNHPECLYYHSSFGVALLKDLLAIRRAKRKMKLPIVLHIHFAEYDQIVIKRAGLDRLMLRLMKKYVDRVVFLSQKTMEQFVARGVSPERCCVIYNFTTLEYSDEQIHTRLRTPSDKTRFLFVGSIDERKGIFDVLKCMAEEKGNYVLHVCGGFGSQNDEEAFNKYRNILGNRLVFHGYVDGEEKKSIFLDADVLLLTSYGEGLPVVLLEAFSAGCAVLTSDVGAIPEIVSKDNGVIVSPGDIESIKVAMLQYSAGNKNKLYEQQARNYEISNRYTISSFVEKLIDACASASK